MCNIARASVSILCIPAFIVTAACDRLRVA